MKAPPAASFTSSEKLKIRFTLAFGIKFKYESYVEIVIVK